MICFPNAKINVGLHILHKRPDGYHAIESGFYPIPLCDVLEILPAEQLSFQQSGIAIPPDGKDNLCLRAYSLLKADFDLPPVQLYLHKIIPTGAGLGGGSADAVYTLKSLNILFGLGLNNDQLLEYSNQLGSDCAFFVENQPALATGRGEVLTAKPIPLANQFMVLVYPNVHISTAQAYAAVRPSDDRPSLSDKFALPLAQWKDHLHNDFEAALFPQFPVLAQIKAELYAMGAVYAAMTGSGAALYGIFDQEVDLADRFQAYWCWQGFV
jgi:4-diphosphocytidyl-2-C-methyl-D-erythritol kinase